MFKLLVLTVSGATGILTAKAVRKLQGEGREPDVWREVTDPV